MTNLEEKNLIDRSREHLANERTFLAWIRTSIALMGFGFVIVKFTLFLKQLSLLLETKDIPTLKRIFFSCGSSNGSNRGNNSNFSFFTIQKK